MRHRVAIVDHLQLLRVLVEAREALHELAHGAADRLGLGRQVDRLLAAHAGAGEVGHVRGGVVAVEERADRGGAAEEDVAVVLPREADASVDLHAQVGAQVRRGHRQRRGDRGGERELLAALHARSRRVPHGCGRQLGRHGHVGAVVLHRLEHRDRAAELLPVLRVRGGEIGRFAGDADRFRGDDQTGDVEQLARRARQHLRRGAVERHATGAPGRVEVGRVLDRDAVRLRLDDGHVLADRDEQQVRERRAEHCARCPVEPALAELDAAAQGHRARGRAVGEPGEEPLLQVVGAGRDERRAGDQRRHEGARRQAAAELLHHHDRLLEAVAGAAVLLGDVQTEPSEACGFVPERRVRLVGRLQQRPGSDLRLPLREQVRHGPRESLVFLGDGDGHGLHL